LLSCLLVSVDDFPKTKGFEAPTKVAAPLENDGVVDGLLPNIPDADADADEDGVPKEDIAVVSSLPRRFFFELPSSFSLAITPPSGGTEV